MGNLKFNTVQQVVDIQNELMLHLTYGSTYHSSDLIDTILENEREELVILKKFFKTQEDRLFSSLGCNLTYSEFYNKVRAWYNTGAGSLLNNEALIDKIQEVLEESITYNLKEIITKFNKTQITEELASEIFGEEIAKAIDWENARFKGGIRGGIDEKDFKRAGTIMLKMTVPGEKNNRIFNKNYKFLEKIKGITLFQSKQKDRQNEIEFRFTKNIPIGAQNVIIEKFQPLIKDQGSIQLALKSEIHQKVQSIIISYLPAGSEVASDIISKVIDDYLINSFDIALNRKREVIRGAIGEIYWNAFFRYCHINNTKAVGANVRTKKGQMIPIDILLEDIGFQVKNYTNIDGIVTFHQHMKKGEMVANNESFTNFFGNFLNLDLEALGNFYVSYYYNEIDYDSSNHQVYVPVRDRFNVILEGVESYIKANTDKLLNFNRDIILKNPDLLDVNIDPGRPTIFLINEDAYPTSFLIEQLILSIDSHFGIDQNSVLWIDPTSFLIDSSGFDTGEVWKESEIEKRKDFNPEVGSLMKKCKVSYKIKLNLSLLMESIKQKYNIK